MKNASKAIKLIQIANKCQKNKVSEAEELCVPVDEKTL
jgi:hypothetical protein